MYIMASASRVLYTGVTRNLVGRVAAHKERKVPGFTKRYKTTGLVYFETTTDIRAAIRREKQIKGWARARKVGLIESVNPRWMDLSDGWFRGRRESAASGFEEQRKFEILRLPAGGRLRSG